MRQSDDRILEPLIIGKSAAIKELKSFIEKAAASDSNVLILGETGVGKELAVRAIHLGSKRKGRPFMRINCGELNENLAESELFGHKKGAFTDARMDRAGLIEAADGGTFFFDEICDTGPSLQAKLLSVIEDKEVRRLGENYFRRIDTRFMFATNKDIYRLVARGKFRQDLLYRISILKTYIPPLRARTDDIPLLMGSFIEKESLRRSVKIEITAEALDKLSHHSFPGNVRELENVLIRACDLSLNGMIQEDNISFDILPETNQKIKKSKYKMDKIVNALIKCRGNKTKAAKELGISRVHLYRLLNPDKENRRFS
jgi:transcriptional regulator with GAF, ATPase, and Fis domain